MANEAFSTFIGSVPNITLTGAELIPAVSSGATYNTNAEDLADYFSSNSLLTYPNGNPLTDSSNNLLSSDGIVVSNATGDLNLTNKFYDYSGSSGEVGQVLVSSTNNVNWEWLGTLQPQSNGFIAGTTVILTGTAPSPTATYFYQLNVMQNVATTCAAGNSQLSLQYTCNSVAFTYTVAGISLVTNTSQNLAIPFVCDAGTTWTVKLSLTGVTGTPSVYYQTCLLQMI